jgi:hypothetical protein
MPVTPHFHGLLEFYKYLLFGIMKHWFGLGRSRKIHLHLHVRVHFILGARQPKVHFVRIVPTHSHFIMMACPLGYHVLHIGLPSHSLLVAYFKLPQIVPFFQCYQWMHKIHFMSPIWLCVKFFCMNTFE